MKPTRANFIKVLTELDGTFEEPLAPNWDGQPYTMNVDAPEGHTWSCDDLHCLVAIGNTKPELWADALDRMSAGVGLCTEIDCDACLEVENSDNWH